MSASTKATLYTAGVVTAVGSLVGTLIEWPLLTFLVFLGVVGAAVIVAVWLAFRDQLS